MTHHVPRYVLLCLLGFYSFIPAAAQTPAVSTAPVKIEKISFHGNRTDESILRRHLPFSEGDPLGPSSLKDARTGLWDMRQFKKVEVSSSAVADGNAEVDITVADGWFLVPVPFFVSGSGGGRGGLVLFGKNIFRKTESVMASAFSGSAGSSGALSLQLDRWSLSAAAGRREFTENLYADGAFSAGSGSGRPADARHAARYGEVVDSYRKSSDQTAFALGVPLGRIPCLGTEPSAAFGWEGAGIKYSEAAPVQPADSGRQGQFFVSLRSGREGGGGGAGEAIGAIFGFGLADMERRIAPLPVHKFSSGAELSYYKVIQQ